MEPEFIEYHYPTLEEKERHIVAYINEKIESGKAAELVAEGEAYHAQQIERIAAEIHVKARLRAAHAVVVIALRHRDLIQVGQSCVIDVQCPS